MCTESNPIPLPLTPRSPHLVVTGILANKIGGTCYPVLIMSYENRTDFNFITTTSTRSHSRPCCCSLFHLILRFC
ncbi:hypothetical protein HanRHA438_Chr14g0681611 [Helianthus annuus]|uniref:Uncharacterized protein n=1 Tax=Helianthus annuus TaxID=4232 RepID=A0A9K3DZU3_HELAN|nr:hypothetical protein HanXRQr2_Chr15g0692271 [Helianthus annuus]KAJ0455541.1 hypothetical protein HanIR_Chr15g0752331 [Helianthus annuus]KAJ0831196.1 hypothetical protein HanPSC8_Chr15g0664231 [Helianthus annuus]KAJ0856193.1 hypothetical protein HanRHA438_Chr14g0681611 [Helianthus annuus]